MHFGEAADPPGRRRERDTVPDLGSGDRQRRRQVRFPMPGGPSRTTLRDWWAMSLSTSAGIEVRLVVTIRRPVRFRTRCRRRSDQRLEHRPRGDVPEMSEV